MTEPFAFGPTVHDFGAGAPLFLDFDSTAPAVHVNRPHRRRPHRGAPGNAVPAPDQVFVPHWDTEDGDIWDYVTLGQYTFGGTVRIEGDGPKLSVDRRKRKGANGARLITNGYDTSELKIVLKVWTEDHLNDYSALASEVNPKRTGKPVALDVYHPSLALAKINKVLVYGIGFLLPTGTHGLFESVLHCFEFQEPDPTKSATHRVRHTPPQDPALHEAFHTENDRPGGVPAPSTTNANP